MFSSYGGGHVTAVIPVIREMTKRGHDCRYLALTTAVEVARRSGISHKKPLDFVNLQDPVVSHWGSKLAEKHHTDGKGISREESIAYLGVSFRDLARDIGEQKAWENYEKQGLNAFCPVYFMREVIETEKPDLVIATTSPRMEKAILRAAYQSGVPSICMIELFGLMEESWLSRPDNGTILTVSRTEVIDRLTATGRQRKDFFLTGSPMFDQLSDPELPIDGKKWRNERGVKDQEKLIFWAEQPEPLDPELPRRVRSHLAEICRRNNWRLVVRLHPSSTDASKESIPGDCLISASAEPLTHVIHACDVAITLTSTVGWEVLLSQKPLLVMTISPYSHTVTYGQQDGALAVPSLEDAEKGIKVLLSESQESLNLKKLREQLPKPGNATRLIADLIEDKFS